MSSLSLVSLNTGHLRAGDFSCNFSIVIGSISLALSSPGSQSITSLKVSRSSAEAHSAISFSFYSESSYVAFAPIPPFHCGRVVLL
jgi:hypothetical protein